MEVSKHRRQRRAGYTLVEVLVASSILVMGISAACVMSLTMVTQEEMSHRMARAINTQENAARLYQLGIDPAALTASSTDAAGILPANSDVTIAVTEAATTVAGVGNMTAATVTATIYTTPADSNLTSTEKGWTAGGRRPGSSMDRATRTNTLTVYRSTVP